MIEAIDATRVSSRVLARYRSAYESGSFEALRAVHDMTTGEQDEARGFFEKASAIVILLDLESARTEGETIYADFTRRLAAQGVEVDGSLTALRAKIEKRGGDWRITELLGR